MPVLHVVIPFYNEGATIEACARRVVTAPLPDGWTADVTMVDDCSTDGHRAAAERTVSALRAEGHRFTLLAHERNRGKGAALQTGFDAVLSGDPADDDLVIVQDADLEYDPADYAQLMEPLVVGEADAVIGSRWGDHRPIRGLHRRVHAWGNGALTRVSNAMTGFRIRDMECCYKLFPIAVLRRLRPWMSEPRYGIEPQIVAALTRLGARVAEVPVSYDPRSVAEGKKIGWKDGVRAVWVILRERLRRRPPERRR